VDYSRSEYCSTATASTETISSGLLGWIPAFYLCRPSRSGWRARSWSPAHARPRDHAADKRQRRNPAVTEIVKMPNRGHSLTIDHGWREVAQTALDFVQRQAQ
jgi:hypothetical protein